MICQRKLWQMSLLQRLYLCFSLIKRITEGTRMGVFETVEVHTALYCYYCNAKCAFKHSEHLARNFNEQSCKTCRNKETNK